MAGHVWEIAVGCCVRSVLDDVLETSGFEQWQHGKAAHSMQR